MTRKQRIAKTQRLIRHLDKGAELLSDLLLEDTKAPSRGRDDSRYLLLRDMREYADWLEHQLARELAREAEGKAA